MKIFKIGILLFCICFLPVNAYALTGKTEISCNKTNVKPGENITCTLKGNTSDGVVSAVSSKIISSSNLVLNEVTIDSIWEGTDDAKLDLYTDENKSGVFGLATFSLTASNDIVSGSNESIIVGATKFYDGNYNEVVIEDTTLNIRILSTINTLSKLSISSGILSPSFSSNTLNYASTVNVDKLTIDASKTDDKSTINGNIGEVKLNYGVNTFKINVTSESNEIKTYNVSITRLDDRDTDNSLSSLNLNDVVIELTGGKYEYNYEVENNINNLEISATLNSNKASFVDGFEPRIVDLEVGINKIELKVRAENETVQTYIINVNRKNLIINEDDNTNTSGGNTGVDNSYKENIDNVQTGELGLYIVIGIVIISIILVIFYYNYYQKKQVKKNNE